METNLKKQLNKTIINALLKRMHKGDVKAADELYELMRVPLISHIYKQIHDMNVAQDILHDVFLILLHKVRDNIFFFNGFGYIYKITQNEINHYYKNIPKDIVVDNEDLEKIKSDKDLEEELEYKVLFNSLSNEDKEYVILRAKGYQLNEIAEIKNVSLSTVKRKINRIFLTLRGEKEYEKK